MSPSILPYLESRQSDTDFMLLAFQQPAQHQWKKVGQMTRFAGSIVIAAFATALAVPSGQSASAAPDSAFARFFDAHSEKELAAAASQIFASRVTFDDAVARLKQGRRYSANVPRGIVQKSYRSETGEYFYTLDVPESYEPARKYQVRVQLHGGVGRPERSAPPLTPRPNGLKSGAEQIYVMPYAWRDAPWWSRRQVENLRAILDLVKRTYNVDENRVVVSGVSDGGTGAYYVAMRDTTPYASFLPLNGFIMVLKNETIEADGDLFPNNLRSKPFFIVNGGRDPLYPTSAVDPYVNHLKAAGVSLVYRPQPDAAHNTSWWPGIKDDFEGFVADHPRVPLPDTLSWESGPLDVAQGRFANVPNRAHWLIIDRLGTRPSEASSLPDVNSMSDGSRSFDFGIGSSGARINRVLKGSNADQIGLRADDVVLTMNNQPLSADADIVELLRGYPSGRPLLFTVSRGSESVRLTGKYTPTVVAVASASMFQRQYESGRVDVMRRGNRVEAQTRGVSAFTLLLSPDQFDLTRTITVVVNGKAAFEGIVQRDVRTLLKWAARDNDRTMLFAAELQVEVP
jgi:PDZ domain-containing protein